MTLVAHLQRREDLDGSLRIARESLEEAKRRIANRQAEVRQKAAERGAEEERIAAQRRQNMVDAACRVLRDYPQRPYQWRGSKLVPDLNVLGEEERALVTGVGFAHKILAAALEERARRDRAADERNSAKSAEEARRKTEAIDQLLDALARERHWLSGDQGRYTVPAPLLARFGVAPATIVDLEVQHRLGRVVARNDSEMMRIQDHLRVEPDGLKRDADGHWTWMGASTEMRRTLNAWRHDPSMQTALARAETVASSLSSAESETRRVPASDPMLKTATQTVGQGRGMTGEAERPDSDQPGTPERQVGGARPVLRRPFPGGFGFGFGD